METDAKAEETEKTPVCAEKDVNTELPEKKTEKGLEKKSEKGLKDIIGLLAIIIFINITVTFTLLFVYDRYFAQKIVAVDLKGFLEEQRDQFLGKKINEEQLKANIDVMEGKIKSMPKNKIMILGDVVVGKTETIKP
jgi:hypothetical protein